MLRPIHELVSEEEIQAGMLDLSENSEKIDDLSAELLKEVVGQKKAKQVLENILEEIISWISLRRNGYDKPIASMIFAGPSWVWKTLLARVTQDILNKHYKNDLDIVKVNCADFAWETGYGLTRLVWASAWYIGSDKKPQFHPDNIKWKWRVILFDEIEKAGPVFWNMLLSILDDWILDVNYTKPKPVNIGVAGSVNYGTWGMEKIQSIEEDSYLKTFFKDSIIIMTSNVWNDRIHKEVSGGWIWFTIPETTVEDLDVEWIILEEFWKQFKIEMQWRFDYVVPFDHLKENEAKLIINQLVSRLVGSALSNWDWLVVEFSESAKTFMYKQIAESENFRKYWGRYIESYIKKNVLPFVARAINSGDFNDEQVNNILFIGVEKSKLFYSKIPLKHELDVQEKVSWILDPSKITRS